MRKIGLAISVFLILFLLLACSEQVVEQNGYFLEEIRVDETTIESTYEVGKFDVTTVDLVLVFDDGLESNINLNTSMIEEDLAVLEEEGTYVLHVTYEGVETSFSIVIEEIVEPVLTGIRIEEDSYNPYAQISNFNLGSIPIVLTYESGEESVISLTYDMISDVEKNKLITEGFHDITITYQGFEANFDVLLIEERPTNDEALDKSAEQQLFEEVFDKMKKYFYTMPTEEELYYQAALGLVKQLDDPYTKYYTAEEYDLYSSFQGESRIGIGVDIDFIDGMMIVTGLNNEGTAAKAGVQTGDIIRTVDGVIVTEENLLDLVYNLFGEEGTMVTIEVERNGLDEWIIFELERLETATPSVEYTIIQRDDVNYGFITIHQFKVDSGELFKTAIYNLERANIEGLVIDVRNNPGGKVSSTTDMLRELLVNDGRPILTLEYYMQQRSTVTYVGGLEEKKSYNIVTLINGNSASAAEIFASAMQEHGEYTVIGTTTYGKGVMQSTRSIYTYEGDQLTLTIGKWITTLGHWVQGIGVEPDLFIEPSAVEQAWNIYLGYGEEYSYDTVNERVENLQVILNGMGYEVRTDGYYDLATKEAVESIQIENDLEVTGNVNQETAKVINQWLTSYQIFNDTQLNEAIDLLSEE